MALFCPQFAFSELILPQTGLRWGIVVWDVETRHTGVLTSDTSVNSIALAVGPSQSLAPKRRKSNVLLLLLQNPATPEPHVMPGLYATAPSSGTKPNYKPPKTRQRQRSESRPKKQRENLIQHMVKSLNLEILAAIF